MKAVFLDFATMGADALDLSLLQSVTPELTVYNETNAAQVAEKTHDAEIIFVNKVRLSRENIEAAPALRFIGLVATGTDNIDLDAARDRGVAVCNVRAYCTQSVVEHVFAVMLNLTHSIGLYDRQVRAGAWQRAKIFCMLDFPIRDLSSLSLGIVGYGELGKGVAAAARTFGMKVLVSRRPGTSSIANDDRIDFDEVVETADVISLHCPLNADTRELFSSEQFRKMKSGSIFINTARGGLVNSADLVAALGNGDIGGAAIDVLSHEPPTDNDPLLAYDGGNLVLTPHIAWAGEQARQRALDELAANLQAFLAGDRRNRVV